MNKKIIDRLRSFPKDYQLSQEAKVKIESTLQKELLHIEKEKKWRFRFDSKERLKKLVIPISSGAVMTLAILLFFSSGESTLFKQSNEPSPIVKHGQNDELTEKLFELATVWAEALKSRDGKPRYEMMAEHVKVKFLEEQVISNGEDGTYVIGVSSPWVADYEIEIDGMNAIITYLMQTSDPAYFQTKEIVTFIKEDDRYIVDKYETIFEDKPIEIDGQLIDGDEQVTEQMHEIISNYIVEQYKLREIEPTDIQFEVHKVYGTLQEGDEITIYFWSYYNSFNRETRDEIVSGASIPTTVITLKATDDSYEVIDYIIPEDGSAYYSSLNGVFPEKYIHFVTENTDYIEKLKSEMDEKVQQWLAK